MDQTVKHDILLARGRHAWKYIYYQESKINCVQGLVEEISKDLHCAGNFCYCGFVVSSFYGTMAGFFSVINCLFLGPSLVVININISLNYFRCSGGSEDSV